MADHWLITRGQALQIPFFQWAENQLPDGYSGISLTLELHLGLCLWLSTSFPLGPVDCFPSPQFPRLLAPYLEPYGLILRVLVNLATWSLTVFNLAPGAPTNKGNPKSIQAKNCCQVHIQWGLEARRSHLSETSAWSVFLIHFNPQLVHFRETSAQGNYILFFTVPALLL